MILGLRTVIYPVTDLARGKAWSTRPQFANYAEFMNSCRRLAGR